VNGLTQWARLNVGDVYHVIPVDDLKEHCDGFTCWCKPSIEKFPNGNTMVSHNAADGREFFQDEARKGH
jgi:hypothetical protein